MEYSFSTAITTVFKVRSSFSAQCPSGAWISRYGPKKLYLANFGCVGLPYVTEAHQLSNVFGVEQFDYTTSLVDPLFVSSNLPAMSVPQVYVGDFFGKQVVQYAELSNAIVHQCSSKLLSRASLRTTAGTFSFRNWEGRS